MKIKKKNRRIGTERMDAQTDNLMVCSSLIMKTLSLQQENNGVLSLPNNED